MAGATLALVMATGTQAQVATQTARLLEQSTRAEHEAAIEAREAASLGWKLALPSAFSVAEVTYALVREEGGLPVLYRTLGEGEARSLAATQVWPTSSSGFDLTGQGVTVGVWDGGAVRRTHLELNGRTKSGDKTGTLNDHSTHVAGTIGARGYDSAARGLAFEADIVSYDWARDRAEMAAAAASGLRLSNHSYGQALGWTYNARGDGKWAWLGDPAVNQEQDYRFGRYDWMAAEWDAIAFNAPYYLMVKAAGNDRGEGPAPGEPHWVVDAATSQWVLSTTPRQKDGGATGYNTILDAGNGKNVLTIGAVRDVDDLNRTADRIAGLSNSAWGPTSDGRIKPDLVSDGYAVYSPISSSDQSYHTMSGTSMASAAATGSIALLLEHEAMLGSRRHLASTYKALLVHTADEAGPAPGPDYGYGWGLVNTRRAAEVMTQAVYGGPAALREDALRIGQTATLEVASNGEGPLRVTLAWTDPEGPAATGTQAPTTPLLVNDLDVSVTDAFGNVYLPWVLDPAQPSAPATRGVNTRDNAEQVVIDAPAAGTYTITVRFRSQRNAPLRAEAEPQTYSLVVTGQEEIAEVLPVELAVFDGRADGNAALLAWTTSSETGNAGFRVEMRLLSADPQWTEIGFVAGAGTTAETRHYGFRTGALTPGRYAFRLRQVDHDGRFYHGPEVEVAIGLPTAFSISAARPNPFSDRTAFDVTVQRTQKVQVEVYDVLGRLVSRAFDEAMESGASNPVTLEASSWPAGVYVVRVVGEAFRHTQTLTLAR